MATKKYLTKYARGGRNQNTRLDDGLRAMQIQSQTQTQALQNLKTDQAKQDAQYTSGLDRAGKVAEANRKLKQKIEVEIPEKLRENALKRNNITQQKNFKVKIDEYNKLAKVWQGLSPTLAKSFADMTQKTIDFAQTELGIAEYRRMVADGEVKSISQFYEATTSKVDFLKQANDRHLDIMDYLKTGDINAKQRFNYLTDVNETKNPITKKLFFKDYKQTLMGLNVILLSLLNNKVYL